MIGTLIRGLGQDTTRQDTNWGGKKHREYAQIRKRWGPSMQNDADTSFPFPFSLRSGIVRAFRSWVQCRAQFPQIRSPQALHFSQMTATLSLSLSLTRLPRWPIALVSVGSICSNGVDFAPASVYLLKCVRNFWWVCLLRPRDVVFG